MPSRSSNSQSRQRERTRTSACANVIAPLRVGVTRYVASTRLPPGRDSRIGSPSTRKLESAWSYNSQRHASVPSVVMARCTDRLAPIANASGNRRVIVGDDWRQPRRDTAQSQIAATSKARRQADATLPTAVTDIPSSSVRSTATEDPASERTAVGPGITRSGTMIRSSLLTSVCLVRYADRPLVD